METQDRSQLTLLQSMTSKANRLANDMSQGELVLSSFWLLTLTKRVATVLIYLVPWNPPIFVCC